MTHTPVRLLPSAPIRPIAGVWPRSPTTTQRAPGEEREGRLTPPPPFTLSPPSLLSPLALPPPATPSQVPAISLTACCRPTAAVTRPPLTRPVPASRAVPPEPGRELPPIPASGLFLLPSSTEDLGLLVSPSFPEHVGFPLALDGRFQAFPVHG
jgi:hypothetical protein